MGQRRCLNAVVSVLFAMLLSSSLGTGTKTITAVTANVRFGS